LEAPAPSACAALRGRPFSSRKSLASDWDGGKLATISGGCKSGLSLRADPKAAADEVSALPADHEYNSDDAKMRAVKPTVSEILIGF
jgi:hypothetical protein